MAEAAKHWGQVASEKQAGFVDVCTFNIGMLCWFGGMCLEAMVAVLGVVLMREGA